MQALSELHEVNPSDGDQAASFLLALFILVINWLTGVAYPMYRIFLIIMSSGFSLSATIDKFFNLLLRITGTSDNGRKFLELASDQEGESVRRLLPQGFGYIGTENSLRRRVTATAAALSDDQDEIQPVQHHRLEVSAAAPHRTTSITVMHDVQGGSGALSLSGEIGILSPPSAPSASQTAFVTCHLCGAQVKPGYSFCNTCGQRIEVREDNGMEAEGNVRGTMV
jgi:ribosomal protein S6E (S10)